ncbi:MAG: PD40 domain-containing protein, partial [Gluconacetobacter diazotrophicus]|nr:PD40 domain-containing protein [Gluconacetobacter diazotrophicus]
MSSRPFPALLLATSLLATTVLGATMLVAANSPAAARPFTAADLIGLDRLSDPQVSPDGSRVVYALRSTDLSANKGVSALWVLSLKDPHAAPVAVPGGAGAHDPRWTADGQAVLALKPSAPGSQPATTQVWRLALDSPGAAQVTHLPLDVTSFRPAADDQHLVVSMDVFPDSESADDTRARQDRAGAAKAEGRVYDQLFVRHWDSWADGTRSHLFAVSMTGNTAPVALMPHVDGDTPSKPFGDEADYAISADSRSVFFSVRTAGRTEPWSTNFDIWQVPLDGSGAPRNLTAANPAWDARPTPSPDNRFLAWAAMKRPGFEADRFGVVVLDLSTGQSREIAPHWDRSAQDLAWSPDGKTLYVTADEFGQAKLFAMDVSSGRTVALTDQGHVSAPAPIPGGGILVQRDALDSPAQLWRIPGNGGAGAQLTHVDADKLAGIELVPGEQFSFAGWNNETVHG